MKTNSNSLSLAEIVTDFGSRVDQSLHDVLLHVEHSPIEICNDDYYVKLALKDTSHFYFAPRRFAHSERLEIRKITNDLLQRGIIKVSTSPYCSRIILVRKKNGRFRLCVDLRPLNDKIIKQRYPFPLIEDCLARLGDKSVFTSLDLKDGFHLIKIHPDFTRYFSFATPDGQFEYVRLPFGYCEAPAEFQKRLIQILQPLIAQDKLLVYMDDILIPTNNVKDNLNILYEALVLLKKYDFVINFEKCQFLKNSIEYLGYVISDKGITLSDRHVQAVKSFPPPANTLQVQRFLGLTNYFRKFIPDYASKAKPLHTLTRKDVPFYFDTSCKNAFNTLKQELISFPVLQIYSPLKETEVHTDASSIAFGAILLQKQSNNAWSPVAYFSQATNNAEKNYHSYELEMLATVKAVERFHIYLYGLHFTIVTDCQAVVYAINKAQLNLRIAKWTLRLQNYQFKMIHRAGVKMAHVDALSRIVAAIELMPIETELQYRQLADSQLKLIANHLENSEHDKYLMSNGLIYYKCEDKPRFVVPDGMVTNVIRVYHDDSAHCGVDKTIQGIRSNYWFPSMRKKIQNHIENCLVCIVSNTSTNVKEGEMQLVESPVKPFQILHTDHFGPLTESVDGHKHILILIDSFSKFTWLMPVRTTSSKEVIEHFSVIFGIFGNPAELVSDRGSAFTSTEFANFISDRKIKHRLIAVAAPWANGTVERVNRFLKSCLKKVVEYPATWSKKVEQVQYVINNTYHKTIKNTASKLMFGYDCRNHVDHKIIDCLSQLAETELSFEQERDTSRDIAIQATQRLRDYNKSYYDRTHKTPSQYKSGDYVMIRDTSSKPGEDKKLKTNYKGPYLVDKVLNKNRYVIKDIPGYNVSQRPYNSILSPDRLKHWIKNTDT